MQNGVLFGILMTLLNQKRASATELAAKYELSPRTINRYIDALGEAGIPIVSVSGRHGGFEIMDSFRLEAAYFTAGEYERLIESVKGFSGDEMAQKLEEKLKSLSKSVSDDFFLASDKLIVFNSDNKSLLGKLQTVKDALKKNLVLDIDYHAAEGNIGKRRIEPLCLYLRDGQWYVYAFCRLREDFRFFKLNRIFGCTKTQEKFSPRTFDGRLADFNERKSPRTDVTIAFKPNVLAEVEEWLGVENVVKSKDGNGYWGFGSFPYDKMLVSKIMGFGSNVKVLRPAKLVSEIRKIAKNISELYSL